MLNGKTPKRLGKAGRRLWRSVTATVRLDDSRLERLAYICQLEDQLQRLRDELADSPSTVRGSMGQPVINPLVQEVRQHGQLIVKLLEQLTLGAAPVVSETEPLNRLDELRMRSVLRQVQAQAGLGPRFPEGYVRCPSCNAELPTAARVPGGTCPSCGYGGEPSPSALWSHLPPQRPR